MYIKLHNIKIREVAQGYQNSDEEGVVAYGGKLDIRPKYQREFVYKDKQRDAVINTVKNKFPLNVMYWMIKEDNSYEVLDGQQRTISLCQYINGEFSIDNYYFHSLTKEEQNQILNYELMIYFCKGTDKERLDWFQIINIAGEKLTNQEIYNAVYTGTWLSDAKFIFSKTGCAASRLASGGGHLLKGSPIRQEYLETALSWINNGEVAAYMAKHQHDQDANELWEYFQSVIAWVRKIFINYQKEMQGLDWGRLHRTYHANSYNPKKVAAEVDKLYADPYVKNHKGAFEYILGGSKDTQLLGIRLFDEATKKSVYAKQTKEAKTKHKSNCPLCAIGHGANKKHIWELKEMDADHVKAWSKGGKTTAKNCQMLCQTHNRAKGNR